MKTMELSNKRKELLAAILLQLLIMTHFSLLAQVTVGGLHEPAKGAILDLNSIGGIKGGLLLSNVFIEDLNRIPASDPNSFPGITAANEDTNADFKGALVYNTNPAWGLGVYLWNGENWTPIGEECKALNSLLLTAPAPPVFEGNNTIFSVSSGESSRCAEGEAYTWQVSGKDDNIFTDHLTTHYPESSVTIPFSETGTYRLQVRATNRYSASPPVTSNEATVDVEPAAYFLSGKPCYDTNRSTDSRGIATTATARAALATDFNLVANRTRTYRFYHGPYTNLVISLEDNSQIVESFSQPASSKSSSGFETFNLVFKGTEGSVKIKANFTGKDGPQEASMDIAVQDALCGCPARVTPSGNAASDWLVFQCHNLGGVPLLDSTTVANYMDYTYHGDWYKFGAKKLSLKNQGTNNAAPTNPGWTDTGIYPYQATGQNWFAVNNPCPAGWRVPTEPEWLSVMNNNPTTRSGNFAMNSNLFNTFYKVGDYLIFPTSGYRDASDGRVIHRGDEALFWASEAERTACFYMSGNIMKSHINRNQAFTIRCVAAGN
jgi:uncharacterized protein (TIGR02145 family)